MSGLLMSIVAVGVLAGAEPTTPVALAVVLDSSRTRVNVFAFLVGWLLSLVVVFLGAWILTGGQQPAPKSTQSLLLSVIEVVLGVVLIAIAIRAWSRRDLPHRAYAIPPGMERRLENLNPVAAFGIGVYEEPWTFTIAAAVIVAREQIGILSFLIAFAIFGLLATAVVIFVLTYWFRRPEDAESIIERLKEKIETLGPIALVVTCALGSVFLIVDGLRGIAAH